MSHPMYAGPAGGDRFAVHVAAQENQARTGLRWKQLCTIVAVVGLILAITAMGTMLLMQRADTTSTTPPEGDEDTVQSPCNLPARPAFDSVFGRPTAFFTKGMESRLHLQGATLADNQQGQRIQVRTTCIIRERLVSGGTKPLPDDSSWQCRVECFSSDCSVSHVGDAPFRGGLFEVSVTVTRADCTAPIRDVDRAIMDVYVKPTAKPRTCPPGVPKSEPGICGCETSDTDRDGDGVADCVDHCPDDASKSTLGVCGCGVADTDTDGDGSPDCEDACPLDTTKTVPGACGCGVPNADSDGDGTINCLDKCPTDPSKAAPGICGCSLVDTDTDGDGLPDCSDACPADTTKTVPGACGCGTPDTDTDNDSIVDCLDACPTNPDKATPGICGCYAIDTDRDSDGVADCMDDCPDDPSKSTLGVCGCSIADTDADADGSPDCEDACHLDATKTVPGACGCGLAETDTDGDGAPDCVDACPLDPMKLVPEVCGCGVPDTDMDNDSIIDCDDPCTLPGECSIFTSDLQATPGAVEPGLKASLIVGIRPNHGATCTWSIPSSWTLQSTPSCSAAVVSVPASASTGGTVTVTAFSSLGESWQATVTIPLTPSINAAPSAPDVSITPEHPEPDEALHCTAQGSVDPDGDSISYIIEWLRNGEPSGVVGSYVAPVATQPGELWTCQVQATDGQHRSATSAARIIIVRTVIAGATIRQDEVHKVPKGVSRVAIKLWGGGGGGSIAENIRSHGGAGGLTVGTIPVVPGDVIRMRIGEGGYMYDRFYTSTSNGLVPGGYPGGGINSEKLNYYSGGGGGYSAVWLNDDLMMVAGGGGGAGATAWRCPGLHGGAGGGEIGQRGFHCPGRNTAKQAGGGGSQVAGGIGGTRMADGGDGEAGSKFQGGNGGKLRATEHEFGFEVAAGGGGGGYYGGGSGSFHAGGGGGSSFVEKSVVQDYEMLQAPAATNAPRSTSDPDLNGVRYVGHGAYAGAGGDGVGIARFI